MKLNRLQIFIAALGTAILILLVLCPPWQEASPKQPPEYRKEIGRGFLWSPPKTVAAGCYFTFEDCVETPASDFQALVNRQLVLMQTIPLAIVTLLLLMATRTRNEEQNQTWRNVKSRLTISILLASLVPVYGIPFAVLLPLAITGRGEKSELYAILFPILFLGATLTIFGLLTAVNLFAKRTAGQGR